jgi:uncharacterized protein YqjF (DUF2071 family)
MAVAVRLPTLDDRLRLRNRPVGRPLMYHTWRDLLFLHWRVDPERVQRSLPPGLSVDTHDGAAYVGVVPFFMRNIRRRGMPCLPRVSNFLELNVRTYVHDDSGTPGVWFFSLDCHQPLAVWGARTFYHLPYRHARMEATSNGDGVIAYRSLVADRRTELTYRLGASPWAAEPGTLEFFLIERYVLFSTRRDGRLYSGRVHHEPYPIVDATLDAWSSDLLVPHDWGLDESRPDHACASPGVTVEVFPLQPTAL